MRVDSEADQQTLEEIRHAAERTSPMFDDVLKGTAIQAQIVRN